MTPEQESKLINKLHTHREHSRMARNPLNAATGVKTLDTSDTDRIEAEIVAYVDTLLTERDSENPLIKELMEMYEMYKRDEMRGDPALRDVRLAGYAIPFLTRFIRRVDPEFFSETLPTDE